MKIYHTLFLLVFYSSDILSAPVQDKPEVVTAVVQKKRIATTLPISGQVHSRFHSKVATEVSGKILWAIEPGVSVKKGELLAKLDDERLQLQLKETDIAIKRAQLNAKTLEQEYQRLKKLNLLNNTSQTQFDDIALKRDLAINDIELQQHKKMMLEDVIKRALVKAPFDGVIVQREIQQGEYVNAGDIIVHLLDTKRLEVRVDVPLKFKNQYQLDEQLNIISQDTAILGKIHAVIPKSDFRSQTFQVRLTLSEQKNQHPFSVGELVSVELPIKQAANTLIVPRDALILSQEGVYVMKITPKNTLKQVTVDVGQGQGEWIAVEGNLSENDKVAIRGVENLQDGDEVVI